jgi:hypothetical protein
MTDILDLLEREAETAAASDDFVELHPQVVGCIIEEVKRLRGEVASWEAAHYRLSPSCKEDVQ